MSAWRGVLAVGAVAVAITACGGQRFGAPQEMGADEAPPAPSLREFVTRADVVAKVLVESAAKGARDDVGDVITTQRLLNVRVLDPIKGTRKGAALK
ncbi:MAG: hypothetical protein JWM05_2966, partial [Acidimicrobiales bacterium]|nr:hypothetical protein [Acidimicrobiales bacterium]